MVIEKTSRTLAAWRIRQNRLPSREVVPMGATSSAPAPDGSLRLQSIQAAMAMLQLLPSAAARTLDEVLDVADVIYERWHPRVPISDVPAPVLATDAVEQLEMLAGAVDDSGLVNVIVTPENVVQETLHLVHELDRRRRDTQEIAETIRDYFPDTMVDDVAAHAVGYIASVSRSRAQVTEARNRVLAYAREARDLRKQLATVNQQLAEMQQDIRKVAAGMEHIAERLRTSGPDELPPGVMPEVAPVVAQISTHMHQILADQLYRIIDLEPATEPEVPPLPFPDEDDGASA